MGDINVTLSLNASPSISATLATSPSVTATINPVPVVVASTVPGPPGPKGDPGPVTTKTGSATFTSDTTHTVTDAFITAGTYVLVTPTGTPAGTWSVESAVGAFTITSTASESSVTFDWGALK